MESEDMFADTDVIQEDIIEEKTVEDMREETAERRISCVSSLIADMEQLMGDGSTSDMVIICQGQEVRCHKLIISAR